MLSPCQGGVGGGWVLLDYLGFSTLDYPNGASLKFHLSNNPGQNVFTAHGAGYVQVNERRFERPIIVMPDQVNSDWPARSFAALTVADFSYFLIFKPEVILLGTGDKHFFAHPQLYRALTSAGIGVEFMSTPAACRTYNILTGEDRKVVAGILFE